jgi:hypothetical protein
VGESWPGEASWALVRPPVAITASACGPNSVQAHASAFALCMQIDNLRFSGLTPEKGCAISPWLFVVLAMLCTWQ